ncbi:MAG: hypothetical protein KGN34_01415 [Sphingomonadales bacterium]|nr:hypothetical protein [Sphingomonadales bacterium]
MTRFDILFGLVSLLPAAVNTTPGHSAQTLVASLCTGDGVARTLQIPVGRTGLPGGEQPGCCAKGCHSGASRKRPVRRMVKPEA